MEISIKVIIILSFLILIVLLISLIQTQRIKKEIQAQTIDNILINNNTINFSSLTLKQKIAQMIMIRGDNYNEGFTKLNIGGIFLDKQTSDSAYKNAINTWQENSKIKLLVSTDMEGAWSPFFKGYETPRKFKAFSEVENSRQAYYEGLEQGRILKKLGFNLNFAPVSEFTDKAYGNKRVFLGSEEEIKEKLYQYIKGLQKSVSGTCKHYPGQGMIGNTHLRQDTQNISKQDLELFETCINNNISAIMIGHQITTGEINSKKKQASISKEVISNLDDFKGLIISDEINMLGLRTSYLFQKKELYKDLINAGENLILDFIITPTNLYKIISYIEDQVRIGEISEENINNSVKKILKEKGYEVV